MSEGPIFRFLPCALLVACACFAFSAEKTFKVGGTPTQQTVQVESETEVETFTAKTNKASGAIRFDPVKKTGSGSIRVEAATLDTGIAKRNEQLYGKEWLDVKKHPAIVFTATKVQHVKGDEYRVAGNFSMRGVTKAIAATASARYLRESEATRKAGLKGDVLQVKASFKILLADFGIKSPDAFITDFPNQVTVSVTLYAQTGL